MTLGSEEDRRKESNNCADDKLEKRRGKNLILKNRKDVKKRLKKFKKLVLSDTLGLISSLNLLVNQIQIFIYLFLYPHF